MTYRPAESMFGPPWSARVPSLLYMLLAAGVVTLIISAEMHPNTWLWAYLIQQKRPIQPRTFALLLSIGAVASLIRSGMRGVRIRGDAVEYRDVASLGWPRVRRYRWAQIDRIVFDRDNESIALDLWDGTRAFLPVVSDPRALSTVLEKVAMARAIPVSGGAGLDEIPESEEFESEPP